MTEKDPGQEDNQDNPEQLRMNLYGNGDNISDLPTYEDILAAQDAEASFRPRTSHLDSDQIEGILDEGSNTSSYHQTSIDTGIPLGSYETEQPEPEPVKPVVDNRPTPSTSLYNRANGILGAMLEYSRSSSNTGYVKQAIKDRDFEKAATLEDSVKRHRALGDAALENIWGSEADLIAAGFDRQEIRRKRQKDLNDFWKYFYHISENVTKEDRKKEQKKNEKRREDLRKPLRKIAKIPTR